MRLPFADESFDYVVLHLIVAVVPHPDHAWPKRHGCLKPGGRIFIFDKFLRPGERAWVRRSLSSVVAKLATRLDVVFEDVLANTPRLECAVDEPVLAGGWFRLIQLLKKE